MCTFNESDVDAGSQLQCSQERPQHPVVERAKDGVTGNCAVGSSLSAGAVGWLLRPVAERLVTHQVTIVEDVNVNLTSIHIK